jgi:hypothetical protein
MTSLSAVMSTKLLLSFFAQADCAFQTVAFGGEKFTELVVGDLEHGVDVGYLNGRFHRISSALQRFSDGGLNLLLRIRFLAGPYIFSNIT